MRQLLKEFWRWYSFGAGIGSIVFIVVLLWLLVGESWEALR